jgi:hypothetical protein
MSQTQPRRRFRWTKRVLICIAFLLVAAITPIIWVETSLSYSRRHWNWLANVA